MMDTLPGQSPDNYADAVSASAAGPHARFRVLRIDSSPERSTGFCTDAGSASAAETD